MRARLHANRDRLFAMADQACTGGGNIVAMSAFAHLLPKVGFGAIGAAVALHFVLFGFHRAIIVMPYILGAKDADADGETASRWAWLAIWTSAAIALVMLAIWGGMELLPNPGFAAMVLISAMVQSPPLLLQEFGKRWLYQANRPASVVISSAIGLATVFAGIGVMAVAGGPPLMASAILGAGALAAAIVAFVRRPPLAAAARGPFRPILEKRANFAFWQSVTQFPYVVYNNGFPLLLASAAGPIVTASYTAIRTSLSPSVSLISAVDSTDKLRAIAAFRERGPAGAKASVDRTRMFLIAINGPFLLLAALLAAPIQHFMFGRAYVHPVETAVLAVYCFLLTINQPFETFLIVQERGRVLLFSRLLSAGIAIAGVVALAPRFGLLGAALALTAAQAANLMALWSLTRRELALAPAA